MRLAIDNPPARPLWFGMTITRVNGNWSWWRDERHGGRLCA
jgi:hypothetical protein